jgi:predicted NAD/FAD-dependent oxidoreductase
MTWGKAILNWTNDPRSALAMLVDLNHRYALDGRDPASYGGILWCLGQFDRPFAPEQPICGTVRPRPTAEHLRRLDLDTYRRHVSRPVYRMPTRIAVVGAGISGLACARALADQRLEVTVFDKSPRVGGRMASRSAHDSAVTTFDHGAQYFTARDERFQRLVGSWCKLGVVAPWEARIVKLTATGIAATRGTPTRYVGLPCMRAVAEHLAEQLQLRLGDRVHRLLRSESGAWSVESESGEVMGTFDYVVLALPAPQALALLGEHQCTNVSDHGLTGISDRLAQIDWQPSWAVMLKLGAPSQIPFDAAFVHDSSLSWITRNSSKPGRPSSPETWLLHSTPLWASEHPLHQDLKPHQRMEVHRSVQRQLLDELMRIVKQAGIVGAQLEPQVIDSHFWRYAIPENPLSRSAWFDPQQRLAVCGDWCGGPRVEGAFLSGSAAAGRLLGHLSETQPAAAWADQKPRQLSLFEESTDA